MTRLSRRNSPKFMRTVQAYTPRETRHRTKQEFAYQTLRSAIMRCELEPGARLVIDDLARQLHVSAIPVREAIQMLQSEGLVVTIPHTGATVAPVTKESIADVFALLEGLESVAARIVTERANTDEIEALAGVVADMDAAVAEGRHADWAMMNTEFHRLTGELTALPSARGNDRARARRDGIRIRRYFLRGVPLPPHRSGAAGASRKSSSAMRAADLAALDAAIKQHNRRAFASYMAYLNQTGGPVPT